MDEVVSKIRLAASELNVTSANEATTRFKLIDIVLSELLGWNREDIEVEDRVSEDGIGEFSDYIISTRQHSILIEAKKVGSNFEGVPKGRKALLKGSWLAKPVGNPVRQARDYGRKKGVGFCIATNGMTWVAFPVNRRDQVTFDESTCIVFQDINSLIDEVDEFKSMFSRHSAISGSLNKHLLGSERDQNEPRRLNNVYDKSFSKINRSSIFPYIEREIITAFNEELLAVNVDLLEKCYVQTPERTRFDSRIRMYITPQDQVLRTRPIRPLGPKSHKAVERLLKESKLNSRPIALLTLGLVGSGKTTFLNHTEKITCRDLFAAKTKPSLSWIYIDFRNFSQLANPRDTIVDGVFEYIKGPSYFNDYEKCVKYAYASEINALRTDPLAIMAANTDYTNTKIAELLMEDFKSRERRFPSRPESN